MEEIGESGVTIGCKHIGGSGSVQVKEMEENGKWNREGCGFGKLCGENQQ